MVSELHRPPHLDHVCIYSIIIYHFSIIYLFHARQFVFGITLRASTYYSTLPYSDALCFFCCFFSSPSQAFLLHSPRPRLFLLYYLVLDLSNHLSCLRYVVCFKMCYCVCVCVCVCVCPRDSVLLLLFDKG